MDIKTMIVHTIAHNNNDVEKIEKIIKKNDKNIKKKDKINNYNIDFKIWKEKDIIKLLKKDNIKQLKYYKNLVINKSKEDFAKYLILYEYGGIFINNVMLQNNNNYVFLCEYIDDMNKNIVFFQENKTLKIEKSLLKKESELINDDIMYFSNKKSELLAYIISKIDNNIDIKNQYQTKLNLGSYFLTNQVNNFYSFHNIVNNETFNYIVLNKHPINTMLYKNELYPNTVDLSNPTDEFDRYSHINDMANYIGIFGLLLFYFLGRWDILILYVIIAAVGIYLTRYYIYMLVNYEPQQVLIDNKYFYEQSQFKIFKELKNNWKIIRDEAKYVLENAPKLDIHRNYEDWHNSEEYVNKIKNQYGWIRSWKYKSGAPVNDSEGNHNWLNYGLLYFGDNFKQNVDKCPQTFKILDKIKHRINICGFSYMMGNTTIEIHSDETGPSNNSMAMHLGLIIPKNSDTCKLIMKIDNDFYYETEEEGKFVIFDATHEHYAYNQSNEDRVVLYVDFKI
jgi:aspartyl/asparaginyl beta-hydroxylase (cupin superfamily)